jgi:hypothetical protein
MSTPVNKMAIGGAVVGIAALAAAGAVVVGVGGYKVYQSQQGAQQDKSNLKLFIHAHSAQNVQAADGNGA